MSNDNNKNKIRRKTVSATNSSQTNKGKNYRRDKEDLYGRDFKKDFGEVKTNINKAKVDPRLGEDIKTYSLKRSTRESREKIIRETSYRNNDDDLKMYNPKRLERNSLIRAEKEERSKKKSNIRIKKQASSGSGELNNVIKFKSKNRQNEYYKDDEDEYYDEDVVTREKKKSGKKIFKRLIKIFLIVFILASSAGLIYVRSIVSEMPVLTKKMVYESCINKDPVPLSEIPKTLQNAVIAVEDNRFYKHNGVDMKAIVRSVVNNITSSSIQGGSTIDMQLSKNLLTSNERTIKRKIKDMYNAIMLNKIMTKDEILEIYLNNIYMGKSAYGVQAGARLYFGKDVSQLNFGQCTMLAGITNNPRVFQNYEQAKKRQAVVLYRMYRLGYIKEYVYKAQLYRDTPFKSEIDE